MPCMELDEDSVQYLLKEAYEISYDKYVQALGPEAVENVLGAFFLPRQRLMPLIPYLGDPSKITSLLCQRHPNCSTKCIYYQSSP